MNITENKYDSFNPLSDLIEQRLHIDEFITEAEKRGIYVPRPDEITTDEMRGDFSRFLPNIKDSVVVGGNFQ